MAEINIKNVSALEKIMPEMLCREPAFNSGSALLDELFSLSNRFIAMSLQRNRIMGIQLYKYDIKGFLQWGYNFYYSRLSTYMINPYVINDADAAF